MTALKVENPPTIPAGEKEEARESETSQEEKRSKKRFAERLRLFWWAWRISFIGALIIGIELGRIDADMRRRIEDREGRRQTIWNAPKRWIAGAWWRTYCFFKGWFMIFVYFHYLALKEWAELLDSAESTSGSLWELFVDCPLESGEESKK